MVECASKVPGCAQLFLGHVLETIWELCELLFRILLPHLGELSALEVIVIVIRVVLGLDGTQEYNQTNTRGTKS